jgi:hypothetical protein
METAPFPVKDLSTAKYNRLYTIEKNNKIIMAYFVSCVKHLRQGFVLGKSGRTHREMHPEKKNPKTHRAFG